MGNLLSCFCSFFYLPEQNKLSFGALASNAAAAVNAAGCRRALVVPAQGEANTCSDDAHCAAV